MSNVIGFCNRCSQLVPVVHVDPDGSAAVSPASMLAHWRASPACDGRSVSFTVRQIEDGHRTAKKIFRGPTLRQRLRSWWLRLRYHARALR